MTSEQKLFPPKKKSLHQYRYMIFGVCCILFLGASIRLWLAPTAGFDFDVGTYKGWSYSAVILGPGKSYTTQLKESMLPNYPPLSLLIFYVNGWVYQQTLSPTMDIDAPAFQIFIKLPSIIADLCTALLIGLLIFRWKKSRSFMLVAMALYLLHPVPLDDGAFWGQTDAIYSLFLVGTFGAIVYGYGVVAGLCMALALLTKMQAVACLPLFALLLLQSGWRATLRASIGGILGTMLVLFPFWYGGYLQDVWNVYSSSVGFYNIVSSSAYNFWWAMYGDAAGEIQDTTILLGSLPFRTIGVMLFGASLLYPIIILWSKLKPSPQTGETLCAIFFAASFSVYSFFLWNTQMHERYSFPFIPLGCIVAFSSTRAAKLYALVAFFILLNLLGWLPATFIDRALYDTFPMFDVFVASALVLLFFAYGSLAFTIRKKELTSLASSNKLPSPKVHGQPITKTEKPRGKSQVKKRK